MRDKRKREELIAFLDWVLEYTGKGEIKWSSGERLLGEPTCRAFRALAEHTDSKFAKRDKYKSFYFKREGKFYFLLVVNEKSQFSSAVRTWYQLYAVFDEKDGEVHQVHDPDCGGEGSRIWKLWFTVFDKVYNKTSYA